MAEGQGGGGQYRFVPPPLFPLPQWGGEALRKMVLELEIYSQTSMCNYLNVKF